MKGPKTIDFFEKGANYKRFLQLSTQKVKFILLIVGHGIFLAVLVYTLKAPTKNEHNLINVYCIIFMFVFHFKLHL